jgi:hypothetical protein
MIYIKQTSSMIADELLQDEWANWSYEGAHALAEYLEELSEETGSNIELDIVSIRCEFTEYSMSTLRDNYDMLEGLTNSRAIELLQEHTQVIVVDNDTVIIGDF